jgi:hypothetical protein
MSGKRENRAETNMQGFELAPVHAISSMAHWCRADARNAQG